MSCAHSLSFQKRILSAVGRAGADILCVSHNCSALVLRSTCSTHEIPGWMCLWSLLHVMIANLAHHLVAGEHQLFRTPGSSARMACT